MKELLVRRVYTHKNGISITVEIDYIKKEVSLTDKNGEIKDWKFAKRSPEYLRGWQMIMIAMEWAVEQVRLEFEKITEKEYLEFVKLFMSLDKALKAEKDGN